MAVSYPRLDSLRNDMYLRSLRHLSEMDRSTNTQAFYKRIIPAGCFGFGAGSLLFSGKPLIWKWDDPTKSLQNHQGWSPPKSFPTTKANKFRKENLHSSRVDYARLGPATAWVSNIWLLPHRLWWLQLGGLRDRLGWGWWGKRGQGD